ncbi:MAG TPA: ABC transporter permease [Thermoanaerobaculia bacterium]|nr:ABC transporter permease [Thermoanaerobaculia bacterium]
MLLHLLRRLFYAVVTFFGITLFVFALVHAVPGDPVRFHFSQVRPGATIDPEILEAIRAEYRLDEPVLTQYVVWLGRLVRLDFGRSYGSQRDVAATIAAKLPNTVLLNVAALLVALILALPIGIASAVTRRRWLDRGSAVLFILLYSLPNFWVGLLLIQFFSVKLGLLPLYGMSSVSADASTWAALMDRGSHLVLPVVTLAYAQLAIFARFSRSALLEVVRADFVLAARARGAGEMRVILHHAARNALMPLITLLGITIPYLISGSVVVERLFQWDGIGTLFFDAVLARDYPMVMALTVLTAFITLAAYALTDLLYALAEPRVRFVKEPR